MQSTQRRATKDTKDTRDTKDDEFGCSQPQIPLLDVGKGLPHLPLPRVGEGWGEGDGLPEKIPSTQVRTTKDTEDTKTDRHGMLG